LSWYVTPDASHLRGLCLQVLVCRLFTGAPPSCLQLGDSNVGKSSLVLRFVKNQFNADQVTTVGAAFLQSPVPLDDSEDKIQFGIWDTAGSERYKALAPMYYRGAEAAIVVYDITSFESFEGAKSWVRELKLYGQPNVVVALAANKSDLEQYRVVSAHEGQAYARENELTYFETSAKTAANVRRMFVELGVLPLALFTLRPWHLHRLPNAHVLRGNAFRFLPAEC
jgi:small GTP-binding protein